MLSNVHPSESSIYFEMKLGGKTLSGADYFSPAGDRTNKLLDIPKWWAAQDSNL